MDAAQRGERQWFVVQTRPRQEDIALDNLERQGYESYLPITRLEKRRAGQYRMVEEALFPGYLFVRLTLGEDTFSPIASTRGVRKLVRFGLYPAPFPDATIDHLRVQEAVLTAGPAPALEAGQTVRVVDGPLAGLEGVFQMPRGQDRALVLMTILGSQKPVVMSRHDIAGL